MAKAATPITRDQQMVVYKARDGQEVQLSIEIVRNFLVTGKKDLVTIPEFIYFMGVCRARGLNPFAKDCYLIKYTESDPAAIITAIDFYRARAKAQPDCTGWEKGVICQNKTTGELRYSKGLVLKDEELVGGWFRATPQGWTVPVEIEVNLDGYIKTTATGAVTKFWRKENQPTMIAKVAESQGHRQCWPDEFRGTITAEEAGLQLEQFEALDITDLQPAAKEPEPKLDTSEFDKMVAKKGEVNRQKLENFVVATAEGWSEKKGQTVIPDQVKVDAQSSPGRFKDFWDAFGRWQGLPEEKGPEGPGPETQTTQPPENQAGQPAGQKGLLDEAPAKEPSGIVPFETLRGALWNDIVKKGCVQEVKEHDINKVEDITPENYDQIKQLVDGIQPPKRGRK